ncbi:plant UBX domain-containing protein 10-like [Zingiber officinale]|uniref:plant UBX domain-containing protein 10-like n=1 Tax=Zingiber officinale TaxID=94328 RepID=UPI001C4D834C|nr:plant UBX domain-containing protein 10-like [Zingiber officinale]
MADGFEDKLGYFQAITGIEDPDLCTDILSAHNWDLELAIASITSNAPSSSSAAAAAANPFPAAASSSAPTPAVVAGPAPGIAWRIVTLPFYVVSGAVGLGFWIAGGVLNRTIGILGYLASPRGAEGDRLIPVSASTAEAGDFVAAFERDYPADTRPRFAAEGFMDALLRAQREFKLMLVYLHSPEHPDVPAFCEGTLCSPPVVAFLTENFVVWGGSIRREEGFKMSNSLKASRFPFCAIVMATDNQRIALLHQIEGPKPPEEMLTLLQRVFEECAPSLITARIESEERRNNQRLREEQDAAYRAALEADQARERRLKEEEDRLKREAEEAERKRKEEEEALARAAHEAAEKEAALTRRRQEKAMALGAEPDKGPNVTRVLVRFPTGERKERRFHCTTTISSLYDYVDSLGCLEAENYTLVSNFPRVTYGSEKHSLTLKEAGLHPQASLFVEIDS